MIYYISNVSLTRWFPSDALPVLKRIPLCHFSWILISWRMQHHCAHLRGILCKIWVRVGHGTSPIWLKFCMQSCFGVLTTMFQSSGKFYFGSFDHGLFRSAPKGNQNSESKVFLSSFCPAYHNLLTKTINTTLKGHLSTHILCRILLWNKKIWSWTSEKL